MDRELRNGLGARVPTWEWNDPLDIISTVGVHQWPHVLLKINVNPTLSEPTHTSQLIPHICPACVAIGEHFP